MTILFTKSTKFLKSKSLNLFHRYCRVMFPVSSFFSHDCTGNAYKTITRQFKNVNGRIAEQGQETSVSFRLKLTAKEVIQKGEKISISYGDMTPGVLERISRLHSEYYFYCDCFRCRAELFNEIEVSVGC